MATLDTDWDVGGPNAPVKQEQSMDENQKSRKKNSEETSNAGVERVKKDVAPTFEGDRSTRVEISIDVQQGGSIRITVAPHSAQSDIHNTTANIRSVDNSISLDVGDRNQVVVDLPVDHKVKEKPEWFGIPHRLLTWGRERIRAWPYSLDMTLFGLAILLYLTSRLVGLSSFPIYFFSDEAVQTVLATDLLRDNFSSSDGEFLPTYFYNVDKYSLGTTVYLQVLPYLLFGKSVFVTRLTSLLLTLLAAISVGLILKDIFKLPYWWCATLLLSITPAWFLHSRTAFETVTMVSFYAAALYFYLRYRYEDPRFLYLALALFALSFYSYNPGQVVVVVTGLLLLISDARYHWQNRGVALRGLGVLVLLAIPYIRFQITHPAAVEEMPSQPHPRR